MISPRRGEIWLVDFTPARGSEQAGRRPALVIQNDLGNQSERYPNTIVVAMSTSGKPIPFHIRLEPADSNRLSQATYIKCEQILTISKSRLLGRKPIGRLTTEQLEKVEIAIKLSMALP